MTLGWGRRQVPVEVGTATPGGQDQRRAGLRLEADTEPGDATAFSAPDHWPRWRVWAIRFWYGLLSLWALSMARGVVSLASGDTRPGEHFTFATATAWKLLAIGAVLIICWTGGRSVVAFHALVVGWFGWILSERLWAVQPADSSPAASALVTLVLWFLPLLVLRPDRQQLRRLRAKPSAILLLIALTAAVPLIIYSVRQGELATDPGGAAAAYDLTALGVVFAAQAIFAAMRPERSLWLPRLVALAAAWIGLAAIIWPDDSGSFGRTWGAALVGWGLAFAAASEVETRRHASSAFANSTTVGSAGAASTTDAHPPGG